MSPFYPIPCGTLLSQGVFVVGKFGEVAKDMKRNEIAKDEIRFGYNNKVFANIPMSQIIYGSFINAGNASAAWSSEPRCSDDNVMQLCTFLDDFFAILDNPAVRAKTLRSPEPVSFIDIQISGKTTRCFCTVPEERDGEVVGVSREMCLYTKMNCHGNQFIVVGMNPYFIDRLFPDADINAADYIMQPSNRRVEYA